jgi:hypothetical protein
MTDKLYTDEFKIEAVRQIVEYGRPVRSATTPIERPCWISRQERAGSRLQGQ